MIKAFEYFFKKELNHIIISSIISIIIVLVSTQALVRHTYDPFIGEVTSRYLTGEPVIWPSILCALFATYLPFVIFNFKMDKKNVDHYYSLPVSKKELYFSNFLVGLTNICIFITVTFITLLLFCLVSVDSIPLLEFLFFYPVLLVTCSLIYSFVSYFVIINNTLVDAVINVIFAVCLIPFIALYIQGNIIDIKGISFDFSYLFIYSPLFTFAAITQHAMRYGFDGMNMREEYISNSIISLIINIVLVGVIMYLLYKHIEKEDKGENSTYISEHYLSYRLMLPVFTVGVLSQILIDGGLSDSSLIMGSITIILSYIVFATYKRRVLLSKEDLITFAVYIGIAVVVRFILAFGPIVIDVNYESNSPTTLLNLQTLTKLIL